MIAARVAGVPRPFSRIASRSSSSSISLPAPSIADSSVASLKRGGGRVTSGVDVDLLGGDLLVRLHRRERGLVALRLLAVHGEPARRHEHLALGLERLVFDPRDARGDEMLGRRIEHGEEAAHDEVVELAPRSRSGASAAPSVGMIAKWSEIFELSKMRLFGRTHFCLRISRAKPPKALVSAELLERRPSRCRCSPRAARARRSADT